MASEVAVRAGSINMSKGTKSKRKAHYAKLFKASTTGLSRLEIYDNEKSSVNGVPTDLVVNGDVVRIVPNSGGSKSEQLFAILTKENSYVFGVKTEAKRTEWVKDFTSILFQTQQNNQPSSNASSKNNTVTDNDIYDSADEYVRDHLVKISDETCRRLSTQPGKVKLIVESGNITIVAMQGHLLGRWGIEHLRRFGYSDNDFHFEAGRKSELGPGLFCFITDKGRSIHMMVTREKQVCRSSRATPGETEAPQIPAKEIDLTLDGHFYEELPISQAPTLQPIKGDIPSKPRRNNVEQHSPRSPTSNTQFNYGGHTAVNNGATSQPLVYSEVAQPQNAWQSHGMDVDDAIYEDQAYDCLTHATPTNPQNSLYSTTSVRQSHIQEDAGHQNQPEDVENMYAVIDRSAKTKNRDKH